MMMHQIINVVIITLFLLSGCHQKETKKKLNSERLDLSPPEPDKDLREKYEASLKVKVDTCSFNNPDTSVFGILLIDKESSIKVIGESYKLIEVNGDMPHLNFNSSDNKEVLTLFFHYGGSKNSFSEFQVAENKNNAKNISLKTSEFVTNNSIRLGLTKAEVISKLGKCYQTQNNNDKEIVKYRVDDFKNSMFLKSYNYPVYYADYEFTKNRLVRFRFGFEYP